MTLAWRSKLHAIAHRAYECPTEIVVLQEELGIAPLGHRQGLLMAIADLSTFNEETHGGSPSYHSPLLSQGPGRRGRPQSAPDGRGYSPARSGRAGSDRGSISPERGLQELQALKALDLREHLVREMEKAQARAAHRQA